MESHYSVPENNELLAKKNIPRCGFVWLEFTLYRGSTCQRIAYGRLVQGSESAEKLDSVCVQTIVEDFGRRPLYGSAL